MRNVLTEDPNVDELRLTIAPDVSENNKTNKDTLSEYNDQIVSNDDDQCHEIPEDVGQQSQREEIKEQPVAASDDESDENEATSEEELTEEHSSTEESHEEEEGKREESSDNDFNIKEKADEIVIEINSSSEEEMSLQEEENKDVAPPDELRVQNLPEVDGRQTIERTVPTTESEHLPDTSDSNRGKTSFHLEHVGRKVRASSLAPASNTEKIPQTRGRSAEPEVTGQPRDSVLAVSRRLTRSGKIIFEKLEMKEAKINSEGEDAREEDRKQEKNCELCDDIEGSIGPEEREATRVKAKQGGLGGRTMRRKPRPSTESREGESKGSTPARRSRRLSGREEGVVPEVVEVEEVRPRRSRRSSLAPSEESFVACTPPRRASRAPSEENSVTRTPPRRSSRAPSSESSVARTPGRRSSRAPSSESESPQEKLERYVATHRLTRRQKAMVEQMMRESGRGPPLQDLDPLLLLDKDTFSGT